MTTSLDTRVSRRYFVASTGAVTAMAWLAPRRLFAQGDGLVQTARWTAAADKVTVQKLRGNVSVLMGAGGNIAVLTGPDGKLMIDAGLAGARPQISDALDSINSTPSSTSSIRTGTSITPMATNGCTLREQPS